MAKELPYWKFEPSEWDNGNVQMCSRQSKGLFMDICSMYWSRVGELPYALALQKLCNGNANDMQELLDNQIMVVIEGQIIIEFLDEQLSEFKDVSAKRKLAAEKRWSDANALQVESKSNAIRQDKKRQNNTRKEENRLKEISFESFWNIYDKKVGKDKCLKKWVALSDEEITSCLSKVSHYVQSTPDKSFRKNPETYLNGKHWNDEIIIKQQQNGTTTTISSGRTSTDKREAADARIRERYERMFGSATPETNTDTGFSDVEFEQVD